MSGQITLTQEKNYSAAWVKTGCVCGLLSMLVYFAAAFVPMPPLASYTAAFAVGPLLAIGCTGLFYFLTEEDHSPRLLIATASAVAASLFLLLMLTVQQSSFAIMDKFNQGAHAETKAGQQYITDGLNSIHFGMDIAWDVLISLATILFGYSLTRKSLYWKILGTTGSVLGVLLLCFNLFHFPNPPESVQSIDWGPFVAMWYILLFSSVARDVLKRPG